MDKNTRDKVLDKMTTERDLINQLEYARQEAINEGRAEGLAEGRAEGLEKGLAKGRAQERAENIRKMLAAGIPAETIAAALNITVEECLSY